MRTLVITTAGILAIFTAALSTGALFVRLPPAIAVDTLAWPGVGVVWLVSALVGLLAGLTTLTTLLTTAALLKNGSGAVQVLPGAYNNPVLGWLAAQTPRLAKNGTATDDSLDLVLLGLRIQI